MTRSDMMATLVATTLAFSSGGLWAAGADSVCSNTAKVLKTACGFDTNDNYQVAIAACMNLVDSAARTSCQDAARNTRDDDTKQCGAVFDAREQICGAIGEAAYDPPFGPAFANNFVDPRQIGHSVPPNPYFPLVAGSQWKYKTTYANDSGEKITERDTVTVTSDTKLIDGVTCVIVDDNVKASDGTLELTQDWFAQDTQGNVWYCGEIAQQKETNDGDQPPTPELVGIEGSWKTGRETAKPGIQMLASPRVGKTYRQELKWVDAEDVASVLSVNANESVSNGAFTCNSQCLETRDFSGVEPDADEHKYYLPGVGLMLEVDLTNGARNELLSYTHP
jgi:hypothetical protein